MISHNIWSLTGEGKTPEEAVKSVLVEAKEISEFYINSSNDELTLDAIEFKEFLLKVI